MSNFSTKSGVFSITNCDKGTKFFIFSKNMNDRITTIIRSLNQNRHPNNLLQADWNACNKFTFEVVVETKDESEVINCIKKYHPNVYNKHRKFLPTTSGVYCITNICNNKRYIGVANNIRKRIEAHIYNLTNRDLSNETQQFINDWHEYGRLNFKFEVLESTDDRERESYWINYYCTNTLGYNIKVNNEIPSSVAQKISESVKLNYALKKVGV